MKLLKPKVLADIQPKSGNVFKDVERRVNLDYRSEPRIPVAILAKSLAFTVSITFLFVGSVSAPIANQTLAQTVGFPQSNQERQELEAQLKDLETQMDAYESQIAGYKKQGSSLKGEISQLNGKVSQINLQIKAINLTLGQIDKSIIDTASQIKTTESTISTNQETLKILLQELYVSEKANLLEIFLKHPKLSDFFNDVNSIDNLQNNLRTTIVKVRDLRNQLEDQQGQLALAKADAASVKEYQTAKKGEVEDVKTEKNNLLAVTKGQESKYQTLLKQTKETAAQIRSRIFQLLGGGQLSFEQAYAYAKLAGESTGVRPAMLLAVLDRESALGQNVGQCAYNQIMRGGNTAMNPKETPTFLDILQSLSISPDSVKISCPNRDGTYGGAMGPAQFIPTTWKLYANQISNITSRTPANPWNNADAFIATALYIKDAYNSQACISYSKQIPNESSALRERCAAAKYYAGSRWYNYRFTYGQAVVSLANKFQEDIDTISTP